MAVEILPDGRKEVTASRYYFIAAGITSAAVGAVLSYTLHELFGWRFVPWSIAAGFGYFSLRRLVQGLSAIPEQLNVVVTADSIEGPAWAWVPRGYAHAREIDWTDSEVNRRHVVLYSDGSRAIGLRLAWYSPADRGFIRQSVEALRLSVVDRAASCSDE